MDGILLVDKPKGWTSFDVVAKVRGIVRTELRKTNPGLKNYKVGHIGTLDPSATGLIVLCLGKYTKKVPEMIKHDKTYEVEVTLGATSSTGDQEGEITTSKYAMGNDAITQKIGDNQGIDSVAFTEPTIEKIDEVMDSFVGEQWQTPPIYSAIKVNGTRAYDLARAGKEVKLEPRQCTVYNLQLRSYNFPLVVFTCEVSSGTYIRSLAEDIGNKLGIGAYLSELRRTEVAEYDIKDALTVEELSFKRINESLIL